MVQTGNMIEPKISEMRFIIFNYILPHQPISSPIHLFSSTSEPKYYLGSFLNLSICLQWPAVLLWNFFIATVLQTPYAFQILPQLQSCTIASLVWYISLKHEIQFKIKCCDNPPKKPPSHSFS